MHGFGHRLTAAAGWLAVAHLQGVPGWQGAAGAGIAAAFSAGPTSPDIDNTRIWRRLDRWLPDEALGDGGPLGHRQLMHWWGLPALVAWLAYGTSAPWYAWAGIFGWASHLAADFLFGQEGYGTGRGIPLAPWGWHVGLGLKSGGWIERTMVPLAAAAVVWWVTGAPGADQITALR